MFSARFVLPAILLALPAALRAQATTPAASTAIPAQSLATGAAGTIDLRNHFTLPGVTGQLAQFDTVLGRFNIELRADAAPRHAANFLAYVQSGAYAGSFFHRSAALESGGTSIVQGGGFRTTADTTITQVPTLSPVPLEYNLPNTRGTIAAARSSDVNSATSQWYFNLRDNTTVLGPTNGGGYTVFGRVIGNGMNVVDAIGALAVVNAGSPFNELPVRNLTGTNVTAANLVIVNSVSAATIYPGGSGPAVITFSATSSQPAVVTAAVSGSTLTLTPVAAGTATVTVTATDTNSGTASQSVSVTVSGSGGGSSAPVITIQPQSQIRVASGTAQTVVLGLAATGSPAPAYQWRRSGAALPDQTSATLILPNATEAVAGTYTCVVSNSAGSVESRPATLSFAATAPAEVGRLRNLSIRTNAGTGAQTLIVGFSLGGAGTSGTAPLLVRAVGPSLGQFGLTGVLADPVATLFQGTATVGTNDNWGGGAALAERAAQVGAFALLPAGLDAALAPSPAVGSYTVQVSERTGRTGIALAEIYDATTAASFTSTTPRLVNVSARTEVGAGSDILIAGFFIGGSTSRTVLIRAIGPALAIFGVTDTLADPRLQLFSGTKLVGENDNWGGQAGLAGAAVAVGAFALANPASGDAVLLLTLPPGGYTAQVSGANNGTGVALVEVYELP